MDRGDKPNERLNARLWCGATTTPPHFAISVAQGGDRATVDVNDPFEDPPQYTIGDADVEKPTWTRNQLESRIVKLWIKVWLGLYLVDESQDRSHYDRIEALYLGTGLTCTYHIGELRALRRYFIESVKNNGMASLKLFPGLSFSMLLSVVRILEAYESEIENLKLLYSILRGSQLALHETADPAQLTVLRNEYMAIAKPMEKRIRQYDIRMNVVNMEIYDEVMGFDERPTGEFVYYKALPNQRRR
ncbi:hypothetical protein N7475_005047 [Penicillium sp. IBT 31633x]|nr:hypothetical protein N7475_005047 [Penicillium sp. IBT 31633x]